MEINSKKVDKALVLGVSGRLDAITSPDFEEKVCKFIDDGETRIVFDFSSLDYISSAGLRAILFAAKRIKEIDGAVAFSCITGMISEVFEISGFGTMFELYDSALEAAQAVSKRD